MAQVYNNFRVVDYEISTGHIAVVWYDDTRDGGGQLVTPIRQQYLLRRAHKIPIEAEQNNWTRADLLQFLLLEIEDVADIPQWAIDEAGKTRAEERYTVEIIP